MPTSNPPLRQMSVILRPPMKLSRGKLRIVTAFEAELTAMMWMASQPPPTSGGPVGASLPLSATKVMPLCGVGNTTLLLTWTRVTVGDGVWDWAGWSTAFAPQRATVEARRAPMSRTSFLTVGLQGECPGGMVGGRLGHAVDLRR